MERSTKVSGPTPSMVKGVCFTGSKNSTSTGSPKTRNLSGSTPLASKMSLAKCVGTQSWSIWLSRKCQPSGSRSVSNMVRPTANPTPEGGHKAVGQRGVGTAHAPGSLWQMATAEARFLKLARESRLSRCRREAGRPETKSWSYLLRNKTNE